MVKAYEFLFYKLYLWSVKVNGKDYYNVFSASLMISLILLVNFFTILPIINMLTGRIIKLPVMHNFTVGIITAGWGICNYIYFNFNNRYLNILKRYKYEDAVDAKKGNLIIIFYVIGSFLLLIFTMFLGVHLRHN